MRSYPVLDPVSQAYPEVQGRSPTCYSPVRHSSTPKGAFPFDLHVLSTPPAFVLSQDQTLQTKTPHHQGRAEFPIRKHPDKQNNKPHPNTGTSEHGQKQQQNKTTKHTIEFSNNTRSAAQPDPRLLAAYSLHGRRRIHRSGASLWDIVALDGLAASRRLDQVTREITRSQTTC